MPPSATLTTTELNRALLARQGLLEPFAEPVPAVLERIGAVQAQQWTAVPVALWTRSAAPDPHTLPAALDRGELLLGTLLRRTLHLVSAAEFPDYAAVAFAAGAGDWWRTGEGEPPAAAGLLADLRAHAAGTPRTVEEVTAFLESWVERHPGALGDAELEVQRTYSWRPVRSVPAFVRAPAAGGWSAGAADALLAAPEPTADVDLALERVIRAHLRAFGPAAADDVAGWIGWKTPPVREALGRIADDLVEFADGRRVLYDLPDAPRPAADTPAPVRLLPAFDSTLLAYASKHRARILADEHRAAVYVRANLQIKPTVLVDGMVAGTWALDRKRRTTTLTVTPLGPLSRAVRTELTEEAARLARLAQPEARDHAVVIAD